MSASSPVTSSDAPALLAAWPRTAQWALGFVLGVAVLFIILHVVFGSLSDARPGELERGVVLTQPLNLNTADVAQLRQIPGLGKDVAANIIEYRTSRGGFRSIEELVHVPGIGKGRLAQFSPWLYVEVEETAASAEEGPVVSVAEKRPLPGDPVKRPKKADAIKGPVDLNTATVEELKRVPWLGKELAPRIVAARREKPFQSVDDLIRVPGIKAKTLEKVRPYLTVKNPGKRDL
jgi:competence protein ComEA